METTITFSIPTVEGPTHLVGETERRQVQGGLFTQTHGPLGGASKEVHQQEAPAKGGASNV